MSTPNAFSNLLGLDYRDREKLISRGACISWSPKNLASALIMFSIRWMADNTSFRFFTAYSDVDAKELGTIYQACNFIYLGQHSGAREEFLDPNDPDRGWFSDRQFRKTSQVKRYAKDLGIELRKDWCGRDKIHWQKIPADIQERLKHQSFAHMGRCQRRRLQPKHKYLYILGRDRRETKFLTQVFEERNPRLIDLVYPKIRGAVIDTADNQPEYKENILTKVPETIRPQEMNGKKELPEKTFLTPKEVAAFMGISEWSIYNLIKRDGKFPAMNIGIKKKWVIHRERYFQWLESRANQGHSA